MQVSESGHSANVILQSANLDRRKPMSNTLHTTFLALHCAPTPLVLANAWDAASAALFARDGADAIATSSASMAWSLGYADGGKLSRNELLAAIARIQRVIQIPLTVDLEDGYSDAPQTVASLVAEVAALGVVGINLEDGAKAPELLADKIAAVRQTLGPTALFINARTDVFLRGLAQGDAATHMVVERAKLFQAAGTSGLFVPGMVTVEDTTRVASQSTLPLNLMLRPGMPNISTLFAVGARRFSAGSATAQAVYGHARALGQALLVNQDASGLFENAMDYGAMNAMFE